MKYAFEMGPGAMIHIPSFVKIGSGIEKFDGGGTHTHSKTHRQQGDLVSLLLFFQNKESRLKWILEKQNVIEMDSSHRVL
jgi:hypothetical protein